MYIGALFTDSVVQPQEVIPSLLINFSSLLTILCWIFLFGFVVTLFSAKTRTLFFDFFKDKVFFLLWLVPVVTTTLSLTFSEFLGYIPCRLCWYQRIFMYSLAALMLVYWFNRKKVIRIIGYVLALIGPMISGYHVFIEKNPQFESSSCDPTAPCASPWFHAMGFLTLAGMAFTSFITILVLLYLSSKIENQK